MLDPIGFICNYLATTGNGFLLMTHDSSPAQQSAQTEGKLDLDRFLPYRLNYLAERISAELAEFYQQRYSLTVAQWRVLAWLSHSDVLTAKQIRDATNMDKARVSRAVQALVERGLINRSPSNHDQRHHDLHLTHEGHVLLAKLIPEAQAWEAELVANLTAGEHEQLMRLITKLERQLDRLESSHSD